MLDLTYERQSEAAALISNRLGVVDLRYEPLARDPKTPFEIERNHPTIRQR